MLNDILWNRSWNVGADDPDDRKPMIWPDLTYQAEIEHPYGWERQIDSVRFIPASMSIMQFNPTEKGF